MSEAPQSPPVCHLLALPRELRDIIYEYAFSDTEAAIHGWMEERPQIAIQPAGLVMANKQIHAEAYDLYFKHTTFYAIGTFNLRLWHLKLTTRARKAIRAVQVFEVLDDACSAAIAKVPARLNPLVVSIFEDMKSKKRDLLQDDLSCAVEVDILTSEQYRQAQELEEVSKLEGASK